MTEWEWFSDSVVVHVFLFCLLMANNRERSWQGHIVKRGEFITSVEKISRTLNLSIQQTRTALRKLKSTNEITIETTNKFTRITICNFGSYQSNKDGDQQTNQQAEQQTNNKRITNKQQTNNNNVRSKEVKNVRIDSIDYAQAVDELSDEIKAPIMEIADEVEKWLSYKKTEFRKSYKSAITFKTFLKHLYDLGQGNPEIMRAIIEQSIANRYEGIFELKKSSYGNTNIAASDSYISTDRIVAAGRAMANAAK